MKSFARSALPFLFVGLFLPTLDAQESAPAPTKYARARRAVASREEVDALQKEVTSQREEIAALKSMVKKLVESNRQAAVASLQAESTAAEAQNVAGLADGTASQAQSAAMYAQKTAAQAQTDLVQLKSNSRRQQETLEKRLSAAALRTGWNGEHFFVTSTDGDFELSPYGYLQTDYRGYDGSATPANTFAIRRGRFGFQGKLYKHYELNLLADFADRNSTLVREFSLNANYHPALQLKSGQFKEPFSQEELLSAPYIDFVERSPVNNLVPAYSPGVQVWGQLLNGAVEYALGAFNGRGFLNLNEQSSPEGVLRLRLYPWRNGSVPWLKGFGFGGAVTDGRTRNGSSFTGLMPTRTFIFFKTEPVNGQVIRSNGELTWTVGPATLRAEYVQTNQDRQSLGQSGTNLPGVVAKAYYISTTYLLTGEKRPENGQPRPRSMFLSGEHHGVGAWELKFRYSNIQMAAGAVENRADQMSTGVNWYPNSLVRYMLDFNVERLKNPITSPTPLAPQSFLSVLQRLQFRF